MYVVGENVVFTMTVDNSEVIAPELMKKMKYNAFAMTLATFGSVVGEFVILAITTGKSKIITLVRMKKIKYNALAKVLVTFYSVIGKLLSSQ